MFNHLMVTAARSASLDRWIFDFNRPVLRANDYRWERRRVLSCAYCVRRHDATASSCAGCGATETKETR